MTPQILLDAQHNYTVDGRNVDGVTSIITAAVGDRWPCDPWYLQRGTAVHECYRLLALDEDLEQYYIDDDCVPYIGQWLTWLAQANIRVLMPEIRVYSRIYNYCGTIDLVCDLDNLLTIIDYKASASERDKWQLAAYALAWKEQTGKEVKQVIGLEIKPEGWKQKAWRGAELRRITSEWLAIRTVARIKKEAGK
jgi:hypothetical protein